MLRSQSTAHDHMDHSRRRSSSASRPSLHIRANYLVKRLGDFTGKLTFRAKDTRGRVPATPYRETQSKDFSRKPFMSQPVLCPLQDHPEHSSSPGTSSFATSTHSLSNGVTRRSSSRDRSSALYGPKVVSMDVFPSPRDTAARTSAETSAERGRLQTARQTPCVVVSSPSHQGRRSLDVIMPYSQRLINGGQGHPAHPHRDAGRPASSSATETRCWTQGRRSADATRPSGPRVNDNVGDHYHVGALVDEPEGSESNSSASYERAIASADAAIRPPGAVAGGASPTLSSAIFTITQNAAAVGQSTQGSNGAQQPVPRLSSLPALDMDLTNTPETRARLSPSVICRPPPLPLLNLPTLPVLSAAAQPSPRPRQVASRLNSMPLLPLEGVDEREIDPDNENADLEEEDEEDDMDEDEPQSNPNAASPGSDDEGAEDDIAAASSGSRRSERPRIGLEDVQIPQPELFLLGHEASKESSPAQAFASIRIAPATPGSGIERGDATTPKASQRRDYFSAFPSGAVGGLVSPWLNPRAYDYLQVPQFGASSSRTPDPLSSPAISSPSMPPLPSPRPGLYHQASKSMVDLLFTKKDDKKVADSFDSRGRSGVDVKGKGKTPEAPAFLGSPEHTELVTKALAPDLDMDRSSTEPLKDTSPAPPPSPLRRQRSMPTFTVSGPPPPYPFFPPHPHSAPFIPTPRDEEGCEALPGYSNDVHIVAIMPRKVEFVAPGVQARDRKWRRVLCVLEGTAFRVYSCPPRVSGVGVLGEWWERKVGVGDVSLVGGNFGGVGTTVSSDVMKRSEPTPEKLEDEEERRRQPTSGRNDPHPTETPSETPSHRSKKSVASLLHPSRGQGATASSSTTSFGNSRSSSASRPPSPFANTTPRSSLQLSRPSSQLSAYESRSNVSMSGSAQSVQQPGIVATPSRSNMRGHSRSTSAASLTIPELSPKDLLREYTLQHAESGLASDYTKRKNVIRVRMEGEQFLLQAVDIADVIEWIEGLQAAANISLDLDERPMPKGPIFPRRRRRRRTRPQTEGAATGAAP